MEEIIKDIIDRLNKVKEQCKIEFNPFDVDVEGDIHQYKIVECIDDEGARNKDIKIGEFYEVVRSDKFNYKLRDIGVWQYKGFFKEPVVIKVICKGDYYELLD